MATTDQKTPIELRMPPQDIEAEMSTLGSLLLDHEAIFKVADTLKPQDFYKSAHRAVYEAILELYAKQEPIDVLSITSRLRETGKLEYVGGSAYLTSLVNVVPTATHVMHYATIVRKKRKLRELIEASSFIAQLGYKESEDVERLVDEAEQKIFAIAKDSLQAEFLEIKDAMEEAWARIENIHSNRDALRGVTTGFQELDNILGGLQRSDFIVLAARPSLGKTSLALDIARHASRSGTAVGVFSLEMSKEQLVDRLIAAEAAVDLWKLRTGHLEQEEFPLLQTAMASLSDLPLFLDDTPSPTVIELRAKARRLLSEKKLGLVVIDYLQLIKGYGSTENRVQEVSEISRMLKAMAKELNVPVLALSQLSRGVEMRPAGKPKLSDLRESGSIEQDADVVMFIYREDKVKENSDAKNIAQIMIEKHRNGPTGRADLYFHENTASFRPLDKHLEDQF